MEEKKKSSIAKIIGTVIVVLLAIVGVIFIFQMIFGENKNQENDEMENLSTQLKGIYSDLIVYSSADKQTLFLELNNWNNSLNSDKLSSIMEIVKKNLEKEEYRNYKKFITLTHLESNGKKNALLVQTSYNIPNFTKDSINEYIIFEEYENLNKTLKETMEGYTELYNTFINSVN